MRAFGLWIPYFTLVVVEWIFWIMSEDCVGWVWGRENVGDRETCEVLVGELFTSIVGLVQWKRVETLETLEYW